MPEAMGWAREYGPKKASMRSQGVMPLYYCPTCERLSLYGLSYHLTLEVAVWLYTSNENSAIFRSGKKVLLQLFLKITSIVVRVN